LIKAESIRHTFSDLLLLLSRIHFALRSRT
jgi:hypothetical protein